MNVMRQLIGDVPHNIQANVDMVKIVIIGISIIDKIRILLHRRLKYFHLIAFVRKKGPTN